MAMFWLRLCLSCLPFPFTAHKSWILAKAHFSFLHNARTLIFSFRPSSFLSAQDEDWMIQLIQRKQAQAVNNPGLQGLMFNGGHNAPIPARDFFNLLTSIEEFAHSNIQIYVRCLGTKYTLRWSFLQSQSAVMDLIAEQFIRLNDTISHRVDVCLSICSPDAAVFIKRNALADFARQVQGSVRFFHILGFSMFANMQCSSPRNAVISKTNMYTSMLGSLRAAGQLPTANCKPVTHLLLLQSLAVPLVADMLRANSNQLANTNSMISQLGTRAWSARLEVSTTVHALPAAMDILKEFALVDQERGFVRNIFVFQPTELICNYIKKVLTYLSGQFAFLASTLRTEGCLAPTALMQVAVLEDLAYHSFLYGQLLSDRSRQARYAAMATNSAVMPVKELHFDAGSLNDIAQLVAKRTPNVPHYIITLASRMAIYLQETCDIRTHAVMLTKHVLLALNSELHCIASKSLYHTLYDNCGFLAGTHRRSPFNATVLRECPELLRIIHNIFFIKHDVQRMQYWQLHDCAMQL